MKSFVRKVAAVLSLTMLLTSVDIGSLKVVRAETEGNNPVKPAVAGPVVAGSGAVTPGNTPVVNTPARNTQGAGRAAAAGAGQGEQSRGQGNDETGGIKSLLLRPKMHMMRRPISNKASIRNPAWIRKTWEPII